MTAQSDPTPPQPGQLVGNLAEPILLPNLQLDGISASAARAGEKVQLWTRLFLTSDEKIFHRIVSAIAGHLTFLANQTGHAVSLDRADTVLLVIKPDNTGHLWVDTAAMSNSILARRNIQPGTAVFESDILDILGVSFPLAGIGPEDRVLVIMRVGWRFAFFADFNPDRQFSVPNMERDLGTLYRQLKYADLYDALDDSEIVDRLINAGWFPFAQILPTEFMELVRTCEAGFPLEEAEATLLAFVRCSTAGKDVYPVDDEGTFRRQRVHSAVRAPQLPCSGSRRRPQNHADGNRRYSVPSLPFAAW